MITVNLIIKIVEIEMLFMISRTIVGLQFFIILYLQ